jgi:hypothetical protein
MLSISKKKEEYLDSLTNADRVINVINLVNGKFCNPNILSLYKAIDNLNRWLITNIVKLPLDASGLEFNV